LWDGSAGGGIFDVSQPRRRAADEPVKILVCCENERLRATLRAALTSAGHDVTAAAEPASLGAVAAEAGAVVVFRARARRTIALLRDRGFAGRAVVAFDAAEGELPSDPAQLGADAMLSVSPPEDLARRFAVAVGGRRKVLVLDPSEATGQLLEQELVRAGFEVQRATDVASATNLILKRPTRPDLVLVELDMPRVTGAQFCRFIKQNDRFRSIKVVFCSDADPQQLSAATAECAADGFVSKRDMLGPAAAARQA
jgi:CheY-like chemotaxis protein